MPHSRWVWAQGVCDQVVVWSKPRSKPTWLSTEEYAALPAGVTVRELRYRVETPGYRVREVTPATTLLDAATYPATELADLYNRRWQVEVCQADCTSRERLHLPVRTAHSERDGAAEPGPVGPGAPAGDARARPMRHDHQRPAPPRLRATRRGAFA